MDRSSVIKVHHWPLKPLPTHLMQGPKTLSYNPAENALLITSDVDGGSYELYIVPKEAARGDTAPVSAVELPVDEPYSIHLCSVGREKD